MHEGTRKRFLWFNSLCLCVSAGNKIQHTYPCTLNFRDFSCVSWLLKMRHVHHIHGFVASALAFGETRSTRSMIFLRTETRRYFRGVVMIACTILPHFILLLCVYYFLIHDFQSFLFQQICFVSFFVCFQCQIIYSFLNILIF